MGLIDDVKRPLYRDETSNQHAYPLDDKIELQLIGEKRSRYTKVFSHHAAQLYAQLTEEEAAKTLKQLLCIDIEKASLATVAQAVAADYISKNNEVMEDQPLTEQEIIVKPQSAHDNGVIGLIFTFQIFADGRTKGSFFCGDRVLLNDEKDVPNPLINVCIACLNPIP